MATDAVNTMTWKALTHSAWRRQCWILSSENMTFMKTGFPMACNYYSFHLTWQREVSGQNIQTKSSAQRLFRNKKNNSLTASFCIINFCLCFFSYWLSLTLITKWICNKLWGWVALPTQSFITMKHGLISCTRLLETRCSVWGYLSHCLYVTLGISE